MTTPHDSRFCTCCEAPAPRAPADVRNRPGLDSLSYRIGTFASFRQALLQEIYKQPELAGLATRESDDHTITLIELFAAVGDVLSFYSERIANEMFLRTALERDSVLRMVRLIGYRLRPGLAAEAMLAFTLDDGAETRIRKGLPVMSVPGQDERPQTFETLEEILADARLNRLAAYAPPWPFNAFHQGRTEAPLVGRPDPLSAGDRLLVFGLSRIEAKTVEALTAGRDGERLEFSPPIQSPGLWPGVARAARLERRLRFFGHDAPSSYQSYNANPAVFPSKRWTTINAGDPGYLMSFGATASRYPLSAKIDDLEPGSRLLVDAGPGATAPRLRTAVVVETEDRPAKLGPLEDTVTRVELARTIRGRPSALVGPFWVHVFARGGEGHVLTLNQANTRWSPRGDLVASEDLTVVRNGASGLTLLARDAVGRLQMSVWAGTWTAWTDLGGVLTSRPTAVHLAGGDTLAFARGLDLGLWVRQVTGGGPGVWQPLGGLLTSEAAPVGWGTRVDVFVRGPDRALWQKTRSGGSWGDWESLGGTLASAPAAASTFFNRIDVVARDDDGGLIHRRRKLSGWTDWLELGGEIEGQPAIVRTGINRVDVFARGRDGQLWAIARTGSTWSPWVPLGGTLASSPAVARFGGQLIVLARDPEGVLVARVWAGGSWTAWSRFGGGLGAIPDRRSTRIFQISAEDVEFRDYDYPERVRGGRIAARLADAPGLEGLDKGRRILLDDGVTRHLAEVTASRLVASDLGGPPDHLLVDFTPPLPGPLGEAVLEGNIARASHGETRSEEPLGNGDASKAFARFRLGRSPLTYLQSGAKIEGEAELEIRVNGEEWQEVPSLYARGPTERVYTARQSDAGDTEITFGDGRTGARVPTGAMNVVATYRTGVGLEGRMKAGQLATPLERPVGLRGVENPLAADGGADPETLDGAREVAPTTVRTFGRAVSLQDFESLATTSGLVARAHATWVWQKLEKAVHLTVAAAAGARLSAESLTTLHAALTASRDPNRPLLLANLVRVPVVVTAKLLREPAWKEEDVLGAAREALLAHFDFEAMPLGRAVHASDLYAVLQGAKGVLAVDLDLFHLKGHDDLTPTERALRAVTADLVQEHVRIFAARPTPADPTQIDRFAKAGFTGPPPPVLAAEQAYLEDPVADVTLSVVEAF